MLYFDHNSTTPLLSEARHAWLQASEQYPGNPSSPHRVGARADAALQNARERLAQFLGCDALDMVWTSGATESNNMVLHHIAASCKSAGEVWVSAIEHPCVIDATRHFLGKHHRLIPTGHDGILDLDWLRKQLKRKRPSLVAVMAANNETGVLQPWHEALSICQEKEIPFFCDAAQWIGKLPAAGLGACDFVSGCAHKFGGPKGVGFLKCPAKGRMLPLLFGGKQEEGRRAGTENVAGVLSMLAALEVREAALGENASNSGRVGLHARPGSTSSSSREFLAAVGMRLDWRVDFERQMLEVLPGSEIVGARSDRLWNTVSALMPKTDCRHRWVVKLDKLGFAVSTGSACASGREEPSHVLAAMGYSSAEAGRVLRFSSGWETPKTEWDSLLRGVEKVFTATRGMRL